MKFYDAHSHLHFPENKEALADFLGGQDVSCSCSVNFDDMDELEELAQRSAGRLLPAYGIHPWCVSVSAKAFDREALAPRLNNAFAVGEIGLDKKSDSDFQSQLEWFKAQLELACDFNLPAVIHCRKAWGDLVETLKERPLKRGVLIHSASCSPEIAQELFKIGAYFSFGTRELGSIKGLQCAACVGTERIMVESDSGGSGDVLREAIVKLADLKCEHFTAMAEIVAANFREFFRYGG